MADSVSTPTIYGVLYNIDTDTDNLEALIKIHFGSEPEFIPSEKLFYSDISVKANVHILRSNLSEDNAKFLDELLKISTWKKTFHLWAHPFQAHMGAEKVMFSAICSIVSTTGTVLLINPISGMDPKLRKIFSQMLQCCREHGRSIVITSGSLKELVEVEAIERYTFCLNNSVKDFTRDEVVDYMVSLGEDAKYGDVIKGLVGEENA